MTIALLPRRNEVIGRFASFSSAIRAVAERRDQPPRAAINEGRWATLPGEYSGPRARPLERALPAMTAPGASVPVACAGHGPVILHLAGAWTGRVAFEGSTDGVLWTRLTLAPLDGGPESAQTDCPGLWRIRAEHPLAFMRLRVTCLTSGAVLASIAGVPAAHRAIDVALDSAA